MISPISTMGLRVGVSVFLGGSSMTFLMSCEYSNLMMREREAAAMGWVEPSGDPESLRSMRALL